MDQCKILDLNEKRGSSVIYNEIWNRKISPFSRKRHAEYAKLIYSSKILGSLEVGDGLMPDFSKTNNSADDIEKFKSHWQVNLEKVKNDVNFQFTIDFGSGLGAYSTVAAEFGAQQVLMLDGCKIALDNFESRVFKTEDLMIPPEEIISKITKCHINLNNIDTLLERIGYHQADLVFSRYVLMHTANPLMSIYNMTRLCKVGGTIAFNIFLPPAVPSVVREERLFLRFAPVSSKLLLLGDLGKIKNKIQKYTIKQFLNGAGDSIHDPLRYYYSKLVQKHGLEKVENFCFHLENSTVPYIHTPNISLLKWFLQRMELEPVYKLCATFNDNNTSDQSRAMELWCTLRVTPQTLEISPEQIPVVEFTV